MTHRYKKRNTVIREIQMTILIGENTSYPKESMRKTSGKIIDFSSLNISDNHVFEFVNRKNPKKSETEQFAAS